MARIQMLRTFVNERLTTAAEEIFGFFEKTITAYEEELEHQHKLLDLVSKPEIKLRRADAPQEEVPPEQQERRPSLGQEEPEPPQIQAKQEELGSSQGGEQLQGLEEADTEFSLTPVPVKSETDQEKPQHSCFNQTLNEENPDGDPLPSTSTEHMKTEPDGEDRGLLELASSLDPAGDLEPNSDGQLLSSDCSGTETDDSDEWETEEPGLSLNALKSKTRKRKRQSLLISNKFNKSMATELKSSTHIPSTAQYKACGQCFPNRMSLIGHLQCHLSDCGLSGEQLESVESMNCHLHAHYTCSDCSKIYATITALKRHMRIHTGEKPFSCTVCHQRYCEKANLVIHMRVHTGEKPFSCALCGRRFTQKGNLQSHMKTHTGEKPFSCTVCGKGFVQKVHLQRHVKIHLGERPYSCSSDGKSLNQTSPITRPGQTC